MLSKYGEPVLYLGKSFLDAVMGSEEAMRMAKEDFLKVFSYGYYKAINFLSLLWA